MRRNREHSLSHWMLAVLAVAGVLGLYVFMRELPAMRRYARIHRM